jgi:hypothetical protein
VSTFDHDHPDAPIPAVPGFASSGGTTTLPPYDPPLRGHGAPIGGRLIDYATALVQAPASIVEDIHRRKLTLFKLTALLVVTMSLTGLVVAAFSGGMQYLIVPLKLSAGMLACALLCLPSLYIFSSLGGASQSLRETAAALLMGVALMGVLLVGLAPISWLFSQTTSSPAIMGGLHIAALLVSSWFGLGLVRRVLGVLGGRPVTGVRAWGMMFVLVVLQMTTTLRPLVGPYDGALLGDKLFFATHWADVMSGRTDRPDVDAR